MKVERIAVSDFQSLNELKVQANKDGKKALPEVARQFEGIFLQSMLKSMRMGQHFLDESSPFSGKNEATFQEMLDGQYANNIAGSGGIGLASMLSRQLEGTVGGSHPDAIKTGSTDSPLPLNRASEPKEQKGAETALIDDFVKSIWPKAKQAASLMGLDPKVLIAQAALETGWGKFVAKDADGSSSNNLFNVKTGSSKEFESVNIKTTEYIADTPISMNASFRKYPSVEHSFNDYVSLIKGSDRYQSALANAGNPDLYVQELHKAGYASDPNYGSKILSIYHGDELNQAIQRCGLADQV
ncbi:glucosaminidase domain-containing protein [Legionella bononiensis]|uniref:Glucosaminidase domain-containing protein n=1 Tax=Legionella bononiensis TaxID=2793102 RepID=A0ABS1WBR9_9GAMM|nr:glucosaminidase domain-containing protein [Legionella bononiensis]MBL7481093.1 glucosaminidase domain-containing protein [Legionella bononiensis]MBL7526802.1 glucosaminidase domain-containing protein [Legionella bononiensis]MBL7564209.1 glucosaminidase domain-containing protein [Legionella bononiensis]